MRINKFVAHPIVSNRDLFVAKGEQLGSIISKDTADCYNEPSIVGATKTKILGLAQEISKTAIAKAKEGDKAKSMDGTPAKDM